MCSLIDTNYIILLLYTNQRDKLNGYNESLTRTRTLYDEHCDLVLSMTASSAILIHVSSIDI